MGKLISFLIILGGLVGAYFVITEHFADHRVKGNPWIAQINEQVSKSKQGDLSSVSVDEAGGRLWRVLSLMHEAERGKYSLADTVNAAVGGVKPGEAKMIVEALLENFDTAKTFGIFDEPKNLLLMDQGLAPIATSKGWEDEKMGVGHRVSPLLAPEVAGSLANLLVMPEVFRNTLSLKPVGFTIDTVRKWSNEKLIVPESAQAIAEVVEPDKLR
ncbi:MAG: hypothetical protein JNJ83_01610 [Verrucomicrobiaceae bacterium]|nr:hypothetical protein [Verrucomicrobiaceae bacterium]